jgi:hypothetical protein
MELKLNSEQRSLLTFWTKEGEKVTYYNDLFSTNFNKFGPEVNAQLNKSLMEVHVQDEIMVFTFAYRPGVFNNDILEKFVSNKQFSIGVIELYLYDERKQLKDTLSYSMPVLKSIQFNIDDQNGTCVLKFEAFAVVHTKI